LRERPAEGASGPRYLEGAGGGREGEENGKGEHKREQKGKYKGNAKDKIKGRRKRRRKRKRIKEKGKEKAPRAGVPVGDEVLREGLGELAKGRVARSGHPAARPSRNGGIRDMLSVV
jgi:hypothetical protein